MSVSFQNNDVAPLNLLDATYVESEFSFGGQCLRKFSQENAVKTEFKEESILGKRDHWGVPDPVKLPRIVVVKTSRFDGEQWGGGIQI